MKRRNFLKISGVGIAAATLMRPMGLFAADKPKGAAGIGMCDWTLGGRDNPEIILKAKELGLQGLQLSMGNDPDRAPLREAAVRAKYLELAKANGIVITSTAPTILNNLPLFSDAKSPERVVEAIDAAGALGAKNVLVPFFGNADLRVRDGKDYRDLKDGAFSSYELNAEAVAKVVKIVKDLVPRAEKAGVIIGLENTITAKQTLAIIEQIGSKMVQMYYDVGNSWSNGYDVPGELRMLGNDRICEVHLKDRGNPLFGAEGAQVNMPECAKALVDIGYDKWLVLESAGRKGKLEEDTKLNVEYVRKTFRFA